MTVPGATKPHLAGLYGSLYYFQSTLLLILLFTLEYRFCSLLIMEANILVYSCSVLDKSRSKIRIILKYFLLSFNIYKIHTSLTYIKIFINEINI